MAWLLSRSKKTIFQAPNTAVFILRVPTVPECQDEGASTDLDIQNGKKNAVVQSAIVISWPEVEATSFWTW